jgi:HAMP domain-containing protein
VRRLRLRLGLLARIALALAAVGLLPLLIATAGLVKINRDALFDQVLQTHIVAARTAADRVSSLLDTGGALARGAAGSPDLAAPASPAAQDFLARSLHQWSDLGVVAVAVVDPAGVEVVRAQVKGEGERAAAALRPGRAGEMQFIAAAQPPVLRFAAPLPQGGGALVVVVDGAPLRELVRPEELDKQAQLVVASRSRQVIAGSVASLAALPQKLVQDALSGKVSGASRYTLAGREILGAYFPVAGTDWSVLSLQPTATAEAVAARLRQQTLLGLSAAVLLILLLSSLAWATVVRPIRELAAAQRSLVGTAGSGGPAATGNEITDLRQTFDRLRRSLSDRRELDDVFLGRYQVIEALGTGAMGTVFRGWDPRLQRPVALKTIKLAGILEEDKRKELIATLTREAVTVARLNHSNVVAVYDLEDAPESAFIAMELVDGMTLEGLLGRRRKLKPDEVIPLGAAIARGLAAAHAQDIVHRDIKPANVLLGNDGSIKVSDFGIAGFLAASAQDGDVIFGTPGYLPPESLRGSPHGKRGDLFSLGVLLYNCVSGGMPFGSGEPHDLLRATLFGPIRPLARQAPDAPPELESLIGVLLERDEMLRPSSAQAVAEELERMAVARGLRWRLDPGSADARADAAEPPKAQWIPTTRLENSRPGRTDAR